METSNSGLDVDSPVWVPSASEDEEQVHIFKKLSRSEKLIQFLTIFSFSLFFGLFLIQANMAWQSYQMLQQLSRGPDIPDTVYSLYFDYMESGLDPNQVDLRANTTIFVH
ncbi:uncharacterized protein LOC121377626 [Gigantopelta aegis]|uniref:uncharacterized protein LOC121377626 n=1 Tax=Gigantopelta aegis TaxID=1735272 RepID=UPI001B88D5C3|nr:uncharacterized protein LOC121377626 [Gigantopelta aegis]XP_041361625.1 uncharacterized protein LOC121377626 [Gigantopelta aegis]